MSLSAVSHSLNPEDAHAGELRKLSTLLEASQALLKERSLKAGLQHVLEILDHHHGAVRSTVVLINEQSREIELEAFAGAIEPGRRVRYRVGEGITGQVLQSGKPIIVPQVSREPAFLHRVSARPELAREELTYISVPISLENQTVGALAIDLRFKPNRDYQRMVKFLGVAGSMIAHAVKVHRLIEADRQKLLAENSHLREELKQRYDFSNIVAPAGRCGGSTSRWPRSRGPAQP